jgi:hypothetical protein
MRLSDKVQATVRQISAGAVLIIAGIVVQIEAHDHRPHVTYERGLGVSLGAESGPNTVTTTSGLSHPAYDLLQIGAWALVILGVLTVTLGLIRYWQGPRRAA